MKYQNDIKNPNWLKKDGCLVCSLINSVELRTGVKMESRDFLNLLEYLHNISRTTYDHSLPVLSDETDKNIMGAFVWDHEKVLNMTLQWVGVETIKAKYIGTKYIKEHNKSWGEHKDADFIILQCRTKNGGHFILPNFDPWQGGTEIIDIRSIRYYKWVSI